MHQEEDHCQKEAQTTNSQVSYPKKVVFSPKKTRGRKYQLLLAIKSVGIIII